MLSISFHEYELNRVHQHHLVPDMLSVWSLGEGPVQFPLGDGSLEGGSLGAALSSFLLLAHTFFSFPADFLVPFLLHGLTYS